MSCRAPGSRGASAWEIPVGGYSTLASHSFCRGQPQPQDSGIPSPSPSNCTLLFVAHVAGALWHENRAPTLSPAQIRALTPIPLDHPYDKPQVTVGCRNVTLEQILALQTQTAFHVRSSRSVALAHTVLCKSHTHSHRHQ